MSSRQSEPERTEPMTRDEFERWAKEIGLTDAQWMPVWYVIGREYERGARSAPASR
jgi:hypothetical protein